MPESARRSRARAAIAIGALSATLAGCGTTSPSWLPTSWSLPAPSLDWLTGRDKASKPGPLPEVKSTSTAATAWQVAVGKSSPGVVPAIVGNAIYAGASDGTLVRIDFDSGKTVWRTSVGKPISAGPAADEKTVVVATDKGDVIAFDVDGKSRWTSRVSSEVIAPPVVTEGVVIVLSGDGHITGLSAADGSRMWAQQRTNPALTVRNTAGGVASRGGVFVGMPGGRLLALDTKTGAIGWEGVVATPKGATELERIADVTSRPLVEERQVCAVAFQGRLACFEILRGSLAWSRDVSSLTGVAADDLAYYVVDDNGALHALDKSTGASLWKQDKVAQRKPGGAQTVGNHVAFVDVEGYVHLFAPSTGAYVGRLATDGSAPTGQPQTAGGKLVWQSRGGNVYAVTTRAQ
ncbi:MAG TPA: outer membrane protein assembly factor BamB [Casimicrobiaceae bacterium]|nr:outer membrane protein assembly factor BamB [Casimicrobiaceae bacterium]